MSCLMLPSGLPAARTEPRPTPARLTADQARHTRNRLIRELRRGTSTFFKGSLSAREVGAIFGLSESQVYAAVAEVEALIAAVAEVTADAL